MRRPISTATLVLLLATTPALAQRGGGHASFGGHGGGFAGHGSFGGHMAGSHAFSGTHGSSGFSTYTFNRGAFPRAGFSSRNVGRGFNHFTRFNNFNGPIIRNYAYGRGRFGGWGWPWLGAYYDPWWWDSDSDSSYDSDYQQQLQIAQQMNEQSLEEQQIRHQQDLDSYARSAPPPAPRQETHGETIVPTTVLVFRDQHQQEVQNYAIVGQTLWAFAPGRTQKISLSDLDLSATTKANDDRGVDFKVPAPGEGQ
jgi:hypothetical protein